MRREPWAGGLLLLQSSLQALHACKHGDTHASLHLQMEREHQPGNLEPIASACSHLKGPIRALMCSSRISSPPLPSVRVSEAPGPSLAGASFPLLTVTLTLGGISAQGQARPVSNLLYCESCCLCRHCFQSGWACDSKGLSTAESPERLASHEALLMRSEASRMQPCMQRDAARQERHCVHD